MQDSKVELNVNAKPHLGANGNGNGNGNGAGALIHHARNSHLTRCGLDRGFFSGVVATSKVTEVTCKNCRRAHDTITLIKHRARKWEQQNNHRSEIVPQPVNGERDRMIEAAIGQIMGMIEAAIEQILETHPLDAMIEEACSGAGE